MALLLDKIKAYLIAQGIGTTSTIFTGSMPSPADAPSCITLLDRLGYPGHPEIPIERPAMQIIVRGPTRSNVQQRAYALYSLLHLKQHLNLGDSLYIFTIEAEANPFYAGLDTDQKAHLATCNYAFQLRRPQS